MVPAPSVSISLPVSHPLSLCLLSRPQLESLRREVAARCGDIERLKKEAIKLQAVIHSLETDILGLKKEIAERVATIQDKVGAAGIPVDSRLSRGANLSPFSEIPHSPNMAST